MLTKNSVLKYGAITGLGLGLYFFTMYGNYALGFFFGSSKIYIMFENISIFYSIKYKVLIEKKVYNPVVARNYNSGDVLSVFLCIVLGMA